MEWLSFKALSDEGKGPNSQNFTRIRESQSICGMAHKLLLRRQIDIQLSVFGVKTWHEVSSDESFTGLRDMSQRCRSPDMCDVLSYLAGMNSMIRI